MRDYRIEVDAPPDEAMRAAESAAGLWGAEWRGEGGSARIRLPVTAGVRRGVLDGRLWAEPGTAGSQLILQVEDASYRLHWPAVLILLFGAFGAVCITLWPIFPTLAKLLPIAVVLMVAAWFLVSSRIRMSGPDEYLELAAEIDPDWEEPSGDAPTPH